MQRAAAVSLSTLLALLVPTIPIAAQAPTKPLTVEAIFAHGPLIGNLPEDLSWSPDGQHFTYLDGGELIDLDPGSGKPHVLVSRAKMASLRGTAPRSRTATIELATESRATSGRPTPSIFSSTPTAACGCTTWATVPGFKSASPAKGPATIPSSRPTANPSRSCAITAWPCCISGSGNPHLRSCTITQRDHPQRRSGLGLRRRTRHPQQLLLVARLKESRVPADERDRRTAVSAFQTGFRPTPRCTCSATRSPAIPIPMCAWAWSAQAAAKARGSNCQSSPARTTFPASDGSIAKRIWIEIVTRDHKHRTIYFADAASGQAHSGSRNRPTKVPRRKL